MRLTFIPPVNRLYLILLFISISSSVSWLGSCSKTNVNGTLQTPRTIKGIWSVVAISDSVSSGSFPSASYPITMMIISDSIFVHTGANGYALTFLTSTNNGITLLPGSATAVGAAYYGEWESRCITLLYDTKSYKLLNNTLQFYDSNIKHNIQFTKKL